MVDNIIMSVKYFVYLDAVDKHLVDTYLNPPFPHAHRENRELVTAENLEF